MLAYFLVLTIILTSFLSNTWGTFPVEEFKENSLKKNSSSDLFSKLNQDAQGHVISYLKGSNDLCTMKQVCKSWQGVIKRADIRKMWGTIFILDLSKRKLNEKDYSSLTQSYFLSLDLTNVYLTLEQLKILVSSPKFTFLDLRYNNLGSEGAKVLSQAPFSNFKKLILCSNKFGKEGAAVLSRGNFPLLEHLDLWDNNIGDEGARSLASGKFPMLKVLMLWKNNITYEGAKSLIQSPPPHLEILSLFGNPITHPVKGDSLQKSHPTLINLNDIGLTSPKANLKVYF